MKQEFSEQEVKYFFCTFYVILYFYSITYSIYYKLELFDI